MLILRLLFILSALAIVLSGGMYLFTNNRRYLKLAGQIARFVLFSLLIFALLFILERYVLIGWRILV
jgi:Mn2+/Fe2+ NRAMP family transporter